MYVIDDILDPIEITKVCMIECRVMARDSRIENFHILTTSDFSPIEFDIFTKTGKLPVYHVEVRFDFIHNTLDEESIVVTPCRPDGFINRYREHLTDLNVKWLAASKYVKAAKAAAEVALMNGATVEGIEIAAKAALPSERVMSDRTGLYYAETLAAISEAVADVRSKAISVPAAEETTVEEAPTPSDLVPAAIGAAGTETYAVLYRKPETGVFTVEALPRTAADADGKAVSDDADFYRVHAIAQMDPGAIVFDGCELDGLSVRDIATELSHRYHAGNGGRVFNAGLYVPGSRYRYKVEVAKDGHVNSIMMGRCDIDTYLRDGDSMEINYGVLTVGPHTTVTCKSADGRKWTNFIHYSDKSELDRLMTCFMQGGFFDNEDWFEARLAAAAAG